MVDSTRTRTPQPHAQPKQTLSPNMDYPLTIKELCCQLYMICVRALAKEAHVGIQGESGLTTAIVRTLDHLKRWRSAAASMLPVSLGFQEWALPRQGADYQGKAKRGTRHTVVAAKGDQGSA